MWCISKRKYKWNLKYLRYTVVRDWIVTLWMLIKSEFPLVIFFPSSKLGTFLFFFLFLFLFFVNINSKFTSWFLWWIGHRIPNHFLFGLSKFWGLDINVFLLGLTNFGALNIILPFTPIFGRYGSMGNLTTFFITITLSFVFTSFYLYSLLRSDWDVYDYKPSE